MTEPDTRKAFGARLRLRRQDLKLTQFQLAVKIGSTPDSVCQWEQGHRYPRRPFIFKLAAHLVCDRRWLEGVDGGVAPILHKAQETVSP